MLQDTAGIAESIRTSLEATHSNPENLGAEDIFMRVAVANNVLTDANSDTTNILSELEPTNAHLESICSTLLGPCGN